MAREPHPAPHAAEPNDVDDWEDEEASYEVDDRDWEVFLIDPDELDFLPDDRDFWIDPEE